MKTKPQNPFIRSAFPVSALTLALIACCSGHAGAVDWNVNNGGNWSTASNWNGSVVPDGARVTASLTYDISLARIITINTTSKTVGILDIGDKDDFYNGYYGYTLAADAGLSLILDNNNAGIAGVAQINKKQAYTDSATSAGDKISAPILLNSSLDISNSINNGGLLTIEGGVSANSAGVKTITNKGAGAAGVTISGVIGDGSGQVAVTQASTTSMLTLSGVNTYTGATTISTGSVLRISDGIVNSISIAGSLGSGNYAANITNNGTLQYYSSADQTLAGVLSGSGALTKATGTGRLILSNSNTYTGITTVSAGVLQLDHATALSGGIASTGGSSALTFNGGVIGLGNGNFTRSLAAAGTVTGVNFTGAGGWAAYGADRTVNLGGASASITWATVDTGFNAKTLILGASTATHTVDLQNSLDLGTATRTVQVDDGAAAIDGKLSGVLSNTGGLTKTGAGALSLTNTNTYTGLTTVSEGTLSLGHASNTIANSASVTVSGGTLDVANSDTVGAIILSSGTISGTRTLTGASYSLTGTGTISANLGSNAATLTKTIADTTTILSGTNAYTGATTLTSGTLSVAADANLGYANSLVFSGGTLQVTGTAMTSFGTHTPTFTSGQTVSLDINDAANTFTVSQVLNQVGGGLTKTGSGTLALANTNSYTGTTTVSAGTLAYGITNALSNGAITVNGGTLDIKTFSDSVGAVTLTSGSIIGTSGVLAGTGYTLNGTGNISAILGGAVALTKTSATGGVTILTGDNTYTGTTTITTGALNIQNNTALGTVAAGTTVTSGAALQLEGSITVNAEALALNGAGINNDGALRNISGTNTYGGTLTLSSSFQPRINSDAGTLTLTASSIGGSGIDLTVGGAGNTTINSAYTATSTSTLTKDGTGTLTLNGVNNYSGLTTVSAGVIKIRDAQALGNPSSSYAGTTVTTGAALQVEKNLTDITITTEKLTLNGGGINNDGALRNISGNNVWQALVTLGSAARINSDAGTLTLDVASGNAITGTYNLTFGGAGNISVADPIATSTGTLTKDDAGTLTLPGANTFTGKTVVGNGALSFSAVSSTPTADQALGKNAAVDLGVASNSSGTLVYTGAVGTLAKGINALGNGADTIQNAGTGLLTLSGTLAKTGTVLTLKGGSYGITVTGAITGSTGTANSDLIIDGGTTTLASANTYYGPTYIRNGATLNANVTNALPTANGRTAITFDGSGTSTLVLGADQSIASLSGALTSSVVTLGANTLTLDTTVDSITTFAGAIGSTGGGLTKDGASTQILSHANSYTGTTIINNGILKITNASALGTTASGTTVNAGGELELSGSITVTGEALTLNGGELCNVSGTDTYSGAITLTAASLLDSDAGTLKITSNITGGYGLTKNGTGTVNLSGTNTYSGGMLLNDGTLDINSAQALGTGALTINGGTLAHSVSGSLINSNNNAQIWNGDFAFAGQNNLDLGTGAVTLGGNRSVSITQSYNILNVGGVISGATYSLTKAGAGELSLSGANTYGGGTILNAGTININNAKSLGTGTFTINGGEIDNDTAATVTNTNNNVQSWNGDFIFHGTKSLDLGTGAVTLGANRTLTTSYNTLTVGGIISGATFSLTKAGNGSLALAGANTYDGGTILNAGTLDINNAHALGTGLLTITGGTLDNTTAGPLTNTNNNAQAWNGDFTFHGTQSLNLGTGAVTLGGNRTLTTSYATLTVGGSIGDGVNTFGLTKDGSATLSLTGANTYKGTTTVNAGTLQLDGSTAAGSTVAVGTAGTLSGSGTVHGNATLTGSGVINKTGGSITGTLSVTGGNWNGTGSVTGKITASSGTLSIGKGANLTATAGLDVTGGILTGTGTATGTTSIGSGAQHAAGGIGVAGTQTIAGNLTYQSGSIFDWDVTTGTGNGAYDKINVTGVLSVANGAIFRVVSSTPFADDFWKVDHTWSDIFDSKSVAGFTVNNFQYSPTAPTTEGHFTTNSNSLTWTSYSAVPEPPSALTVVLLGSGLLLLRRRN
ncbi:MAG: autotransporter-associated beta strand repeat-containing protein [Verrucomicrobiota bacterium]